ncbi:flagellar basal body P-ring formation chaperone FlgA [Parvularcula oceani]|jgi:flagella basal body P-ring formation protein FlgA|uniref:flagellar basal body P-ring formation chaperone FlgA n=1 Tax=Parvularcula oceani TaxID=1247963 RepID=UPI00055BE994|nr:flagellar basal body P-ring formation chaperone FlgA [Parvularcula oceani]
MIGLAAALILTGAIAEARLPAGTVIEPVHVSGCAEPCALVGRQLRRTVFAGRELSLADTKPRDLVGRNARVTLIAIKGAMRLEAEGRALGAGAQGDEVTVMNTESRRVVTGIVVAPGVVEVSL